VVGGGLGGAAVSLALARKGFRVRLLEQAPEFGVIGYGIQLGPNVFPMFDRLGITDAVLGAASAPDALLHGRLGRWRPDRAFRPARRSRSASSGPTSSSIASTCIASCSTPARHDANVEMMPNTGADLRGPGRSRAAARHGPPIEARR
jgi:salicylate hydroxylase